MDINEEKELLRDITRKEYKEGFVTDVEQEFIPKGLNEDVVRMISERKGEPQWLLDFRLEAFRKWQGMKEPEWGHLDMPRIDYQDIIYYAAPKKDSDRPKEIDSKLAETFDKLGIPLKEREALAGVAAVDAVFDSVSVATTFRKELADAAIDQSGKDVMMMPVDADHFTITVPIEVSPTFFAWISTFGRRVKILEPAPVVEKMRDFIQATADMYKDDEK